jgi:hypothetical protein
MKQNALVVAVGVYLIYRTQVEWMPWKFKGVAKNYWADVANQRKFMDWVAKELKLKSVDDWRAVSRAQLVDLGGSPIMLLLYARII